jgi:3-oxoacyl-[acyl-carrier-protein] synthase I
MKQDHLEILSLGMVTPVGLSAPATAAAVRAGIGRIQEFPIDAKGAGPTLAAFIADSYLPEPLIPSGLPTERAPRAHQARMLRLAAPALQQACQQVPRPLPLLLALPESSRSMGNDFLRQLARQARLELDLRNSRSFFHGRAGAILALAEAFSLLATTTSDLVLLGGVDSFLDPALLGSLWQEGRLLSHGSYDGFAPGEGAAFVLLGRPGAGKRLGLTPTAQVLGVGVGFEPGHLYSSQPLLGEGLASAFHALFSSVAPAHARIPCVYAGLNGEGLWAKEWGVAYLRSSRHFEEDLRIYHPIEYFGDPGAALGTLLLGLAAIGVHRGYRSAPCLLWCASDHEERGAALVAASK